ncbi:MAG: hypothetical protein ABI462_02725 [Ignavibacteria bacterium]
MLSQVLKDKYGNKIGEIKQEGNYLILKDKYGNKIGTYDSKTNTTKDKNGNKVGTGNLLVTLL